MNTEWSHEKELSEIYPNNQKVCVMCDCLAVVKRDGEWFCDECLMNMEQENAERREEADEYEDE